MFSRWPTGVNLVLRDAKGAESAHYVQQQRVGTGFFDTLGVQISPVLPHLGNMDCETAPHPFIHRLLDLRFGDTWSSPVALKKLAAIHPRKSEVVEMRFFGGLSLEEAAAVLNVSRHTVIRDWNFARAWLRMEMSREFTENPET